MADLANLKSTETFQVMLTLDGKPLMNDGDNATQMSITINHPNSVAYRENEFDLQDALMAEMREQKGDELELDARAIFKRRLMRIAGNTVGWDITMGGGNPEFTADAVTKFYTDYRTFMYQAEEALEKESGFTLD